jgi:hypothetical protein
MGMSEYSQVKKSLRQFAGISLDDNRAIPSNWVVIREEVVAGSPHSFLVRLAVFPETFSGFAKGKGQQSAGGYLGTGTRNLGIEIEVEELGTRKRGSDRTFEDISFERQNEFFDQAVSVISRTINPVSSTSAPQERQGSLSQVGIQRNPADWLVGDKVNVSRPELDSGGITVGIITRVYPTTVDVVFPPDEYHQTGWTSTEDKTELIYAGQDPNWRETVNNWLKRDFYAEFDGIDIGTKAPDWTSLVQPDTKGRFTVSPSPLPTSSNIWAESDEVKDRLQDLLKPYSLYQPTITEQDLVENQAIDGFEPFHGILKRRL